VLRACRVAVSIEDRLVADSAPNCVAFKVPSWVSDELANCAVESAPTCVAVRPASWSGQRCEVRGGNGAELGGRERTKLRRSQARQLGPRGR